MSRKPTSQEQRVVLSNVSWQQFENLLAELGEERSTRLTYDRGRLEMMNPTPEHDRCSRLLESVILLLADELDLEIAAIGSVLLKQADLGYGVEPDGCYYLQPFPSRRVIDLNQMALPDLVVEIAITKSAIDRLPLYQGLGIPEVWRYVTQMGKNALNGELLIYHLQGDAPLKSQDRSLVFPFLTSGRVLEFLGHSDTLGLAQALRLLRTWLSQEGLARES